MLIFPMIRTASSTDSKPKRPSHWLAICSRRRHKNWPVQRRLLSRFGSLWARGWLGMPYRDLTSGFLSWDPETLHKLVQRPIHSDGYAFQVELKWRAFTADVRIEEYPIVFYGTDWWYIQDEPRHRIRSGMDCARVSMVSIATPKSVSNRYTHLTDHKLVWRCYHNIRLLHPTGNPYPF